jgi:hypothetical protein
MRIFSTFIVCIATVVSLYAQEVKFRVSIQGQEMGEASIGYKRLTDAMRMTFEMRLQMPGGNATFKGDETLRLDGTPIKTIQAEEGGGNKRTTIEEFTSKGLVVTRVENGKKTVKTYPFPKGKNLKSVSTLWFFVRKPAAGAKDVSYSFSASKEKWEQSVETYVGPREITIQGKRVKAHLIQSKETSIWVDDKGFPYRMDIDQEGLKIQLLRK